MTKVDNGKHEGTEFTIYEHHNGYVVETAFRAMWHVTRNLHDKYGRQYETNLFHHETDIHQIRSGEVFPNLQDVKDYISRDFKTEEQIIENKNKKKQAIKRELKKSKARVKELEGQLGHRDEQPSQPPVKEQKNDGNFH